MLELKHAINSLVSEAREVVNEYLEPEYEVTLVVHTSEGDPKNTIVATSGEEASALPGLSAAATGSDDMEPVT